MYKHAWHRIPLEQLEGAPSIAVQNLLRHLEREEAFIGRKRRKHRRRGLEVWNSSDLYTARKAHEERIKNTLFPDE